MIAFRRFAVALGVVALIAPAAMGAPQPRTDTLTVPSFGTLTIYPSAAPPRQVVLFISGDGGWNLGVADMAERLRNAGALVVGIDIRAFMKSLEASRSCAYPAGALEELSRAVQRQYRLPAYIRPMLVGYSSGATLVYAALVAAPPEAFAGAISLGFCPDLKIRRPLCRMRGLVATERSTQIGYELAPFAGSTVPWMVLQGDADRVCDAGATRAFVNATGAARVFSLPEVGHGFGVPGRWAAQFLEAYRTIAHAADTAASVAPHATDVADLSLVEVPAVGRANRNTMAVILSGDGGWADLDKRVASGLAKAGIPVVGWSSLTYYWTPRTPAGAARDLARVIDHYTRTWHVERVIVIGYSFGADVAPFLVNRLPAALKARLSSVVLLSPSSGAVFEFHVAEWFGRRDARSTPTAPEIAALGIETTCIYARDEAQSVCRDVSAPALRRVAVGEGHHFGGQYGRIVDAIVR